MANIVRAESVAAVMGGLVTLTLGGADLEFILSRSPSVRGSWRAAPRRVPRSHAPGTDDTGCGLIVASGDVLFHFGWEVFGGRRARERERACASAPARSSSSSTPERPLTHSEAGVCSIYFNTFYI